MTIIVVAGVVCINRDRWLREASDKSRPRVIPREDRLAHTTTSIFAKLHKPNVNKPGHFLAATSKKKAPQRKKVGRQLQSKLS